MSNSTMASWSQTCAAGSGKSTGIINNGGQKSSGGHDHRNNRGDDRTPAQKSGDSKRKK